VWDAADRMGMHAVIHEEVTERLERAIRLAAEVLDHIDLLHRLSDVVPVAALTGATYNWQTKQCGDDIARVAIDGDVPAHFVGSIVYLERDIHQVTTVPQLRVIDGQQRLPRRLKRRRGWCTGSRESRSGSSRWVWACTRGVA
jgi:hypothetical protein